MMTMKQSEIGKAATLLAQGHPKKAHEALEQVRRKDLEPEFPVEPKLTREQWNGMDQDARAQHKEAREEWFRQVRTLEFHQRQAKHVIDLAAKTGLEPWSFELTLSRNAATAEGERHMQAIWRHILEGFLRKKNGPEAFNELVRANVDRTLSREFMRETFCNENVEDFLHRLVIAESKVAFDVNVASEHMRVARTAQWCIVTWKKVREIEPEAKMRKGGETTEDALMRHLEKLISSNPSIAHAVLLQIERECQFLYDAGFLAVLPRGPFHTLLRKADAAVQKNVKGTLAAAIEAACGEAQAYAA